MFLAQPWPGQARTVYGDHARFIQTYFSAYPDYYFTGDGCRRDVDGYYWITGRVDDVLNVAGHRLGTAEIESALVSHESVAEAAVVASRTTLRGWGFMRRSSSRRRRAVGPARIAGRAQAAGAPCDQRDCDARPCANCAGITQDALG